jgi:putative oxidoreductase
LVGFGFAAHGYAKLARGPASFEVILTALGIPAPGAMAWVTSLLEFFGGIAVLCGAWVVPLSAPLAAIMVTALIGVHFRYGFSSIRLKAVTAGGAEFGPIGYELNLFYLAALLTLACSRTTPFSVDRWFESRRSSTLRQRAEM